MNSPQENLVYDRTQTDVDNDTWKGQYNPSDLNRVEEWCEFLASELSNVGYSISITTKTNWQNSDMRTATDMERIRSNISKIMQGYHYLTTIASNAEYFDWIKANNWEQILDEINKLMYGMENYFVYSGVANSGQPRIWQNRFRHYYKIPKNQILITESGDILITEDGEELEVD